MYFSMTINSDADYVSIVPIWRKMNSAKDYFVLIMIRKIPFHIGYLNLKHIRVKTLNSMEKSERMKKHEIPTP